MGDSAPRPSLALGMYNHFKGGEYEVLEVLPDWSEGREGKWMVRYRTSLGEIGVRGYEEFVGTVERDGRTLQRFVRKES